MRISILNSSNFDYALSEEEFMQKLTIFLICSAVFVFSLSHSGLTVSWVVILLSSHSSHRSIIHSRGHFSWSGRIGCHGSSRTWVNWTCFHNFCYPISFIASVPWEIFIQFRAVAICSTMLWFWVGARSLCCLVVLLSTHIHWAFCDCHIHRPSSINYSKQSS